LFGHVCFFFGLQVFSGDLEVIRVIKDLESMTYETCLLKDTCLTVNVLSSDSTDTGLYNIIDIILTRYKMQLPASNIERGKYLQAADSSSLAVGYNPFSSCKLINEQ
jgi:hypothetical protein